MFDVFIYLLQHCLHCCMQAFGSCGEWAQYHTCGAQAHLFHSMWDLPGSGIEHMSPAPAGGFSTTGPPGKFQGAKIFDLYVRLG